MRGIRRAFAIAAAGATLAIVPAVPAFAYQRNGVQLDFVASCVPRTGGTVTITVYAGTRYVESSASNGQLTWTGRSHLTGQSGEEQINQGRGSITVTTLPDAVGNRMPGSVLGRYTYQRHNPGYRTQAIALAYCPA